MRTLVIFKNNLRYNDNPVLFHASKYDNLIPIYIHDTENIKKQLGSASKYWLYKALQNLNKKLNQKMLFFKGNSLSIISELIIKHNISKVFMEQAYTPDEINLQKKIYYQLTNLDIELKLYNCSLLWEPKYIQKNDGTPYRVFSPFYKKGCLQQFNEPDRPVGVPKELNFADTKNNKSLQSLQLLSRYSWYSKFEKYWDISELEAMSLFKKFLKKSIFDYKTKRDFPYLNKNSSMSPYIRFGMISIHRMWRELNKLHFNESIEHYKSELGWREFSYYLLFHFPEIEYDNFQKKFNNFDWENNPEKFVAWKTGKTGYPIIDAGMRELWETGFIHNRVRMVVGSFLVKNLSIDWRLGEKWFWDCLVDADYASNIASWQWVAGTGADAAPYFRIFNPILQGQKFDPIGIYTNKYIPELKEIPLQLLQKPWESKNKFDYPSPIIDYKESREKALLKYQSIRSFDST